MNISEMNYNGVPLMNGKYFNASLLKEHPWIMYLSITNENVVNLENINNISEMTGFETLFYTFRTLKVLSNSDVISEQIFNLVKTTLEWSEVAKGGTEKQRKEWKEKGYNLEIHNLGSAEIYKEWALKKDIDKKTINIIYLLIKTHGLIGQFLKGEVCLSESLSLKTLIDKNYLNVFELSNVLTLLNKCILCGVSEKIYNAKQLDKTILKLLTTNFEAEDLQERLKKLFPNKSFGLTKFNENMLKDMFSLYQFWYPNVSLNLFNEDLLLKFMKKVYEYTQSCTENIEHISFYNFHKNMYYDYKNSKHINVYKLRIIESYFTADNDLERESFNKHMKFEFIVQNNTLLVNVLFTDVCQKLIDYCIEAEKSELLSYEKTIIMLYDTFGFRRDSLDRLNNEDGYLQTMNSVEESTKKEILDYVVGTSIVDVGSGGGILLDELELKFSKSNITGTDISQNVIETLNKKKLQENHDWNVIKHNFVDTSFPNEKVDTIIFSSILHEIYSFSQPNFDINNVLNALKNAYDSLKVGGRIIIRDGILTDSDKDGYYEMSPKAYEVFTQYIHDFKGLKYTSKECTVKSLNNGNMFVIANINLLREFVFTFTWGSESYSHEVKEQFGYLTLEGFKDYFNELGANIIVAKSFLESGYTEHLKNDITCYTDSDVCCELEDSNCIVVIEKK